MMPRPSGSTITTAWASPTPRANASIQASYSAGDVAPPAENWAQSRYGMLYATRTGTDFLPAARLTVARTSRSTDAGEPLVNHDAWGVSMIDRTRLASELAPAAVSAAICSIAPWLGLGT